LWRVVWVAGHQKGNSHRPHTTNDRQKAKDKQYTANKMVVGIGIITLRIHDCRSLKAKRKVVKAIIAQIRNGFNASVAEIGSNDVYQRAEIGFALVGNSRSLVNSKIDKIFNTAEDSGLAEILDTEMEIMTI
jgi:uncharacterized protein YlxP (DUF503 family)